MLSYLSPIPTLPEYGGPHKVGTCEFEIPISEITSSSAVPDARIKTIKFRLWYPTTSSSTTQTPVYWLPEPQTKWNEAYASFMGASPRLSYLMSNMPSLLSYIKLPATNNAPLLARPDGKQLSLAIFSHGLGGNCNTYSSVVGSLASCGMVVATPEHRDGSAPVSFIRKGKGEYETSIPYQKHDHNPSDQVIDARNTQLRVRLWELEMLYTALNGISVGRQFTNLALGHEQHNEDFTGKFDMSPGRVTWAGHSFGAATITQFIKSVFYHENLPDLEIGEKSTYDLTPLYKCDPEHDLVKQITPASPVALLDLWTLPLRGKLTQWLWDRPMPCYKRALQPSESTNPPNTLSIMSTEFYGWTEMKNRTRALLSASPTQAMQILNSTHEEKNPPPSVEELPGQNLKQRPPPITELSKRDLPSEPSSNATSRSPSPASRYGDSPNPSPASSQSSLGSFPEQLEPIEKETSTEPRLYMIPQSAHLSQSDFGPLFPNLVRYVMGAIEPTKTLELNVRAILAIVRGSGLIVDGLTDDEDQILSENGHRKEERWVRVPLVDVRVKANPFL